MKLAWAEVSDFQSVRDSGRFGLADVTCLVGKNESGKTALLQALYRLNPFIEAHGRYSVTDDFPRAAVEDYRLDVEAGTRPPARVARAEYALSADDVRAVEAVVGPGALPKPVFAIAKGYDNVLRYEFALDEGRALRNVVSRPDLPPPVLGELASVTTLSDSLAVLGRAEPSDPVRRTAALLREVQFRRGFAHHVAETVLVPLLPKFLYFDEYYQLQGRANIEALQRRLAENRLERPDYPLLGLIARARLRIEDLLDTQRTRDLKNRLEGAGNHLTRQIVKYWSQNRHLQLRFDVRPARADDPLGMREGSNLWSEVYDSKHMVTTELGTRSRGFVWFFSFLAWYGDIQRENRNVVLLLDEPGLSLHARAQEDLLRYFETEVKGHHQLIYSTHSPYMIDSRKFDRVRVVQDLGIEAPPGDDSFDDEGAGQGGGTRVVTDLGTANPETLQPLQGALAEELASTLFAASNTLAVEGIADLLYLEIMSGLLIGKGRPGLSRQWTITPVGGAAKFAAFAALLASAGTGGVAGKAASAARKLAVLMDLQSADAHAAETLFKTKLLARNRVLTFAGFTGGREPDIEDMFDVEFYLRLVNEDYRLLETNPVHTLNLPPGGRILRRLEAHFALHPLPPQDGFRRERPARYLARNLDILGPAISPATYARFETLFEQLNAML